MVFTQLFHSILTFSAASGRKPNPKVICQQFFLIHVIEKFWLQAQLDPGAQIRSNKVGLSATLSTMLPSLPGFLWWQNGSYKFEPYIWSTSCPRGRGLARGGKIFQQITVPTASGGKESILFSPSQFCHENIPEPMMVVRQKWHPPGLICNPLTPPHSLRAGRKEEEDRENRQWLWYMSSRVMDLLARKGSLVYEIRLFQRSERLLIPSRISYLEF